MRKIPEVLRLKVEAGLSDSAIARAIGSARSTVQECVHRAKEAGIGWPLPAEMDEAALQTRLYRRSMPLSQSPQPDFAKLSTELKRPGVTRLLLWQEYKAAHPDGWQYSVFCDQYRRWLATQDLVLRQHHVSGEKRFVDYAGHTIGVVDRATGEVREAQVFVAVLGALQTDRQDPWLSRLTRYVLRWQHEGVAFLGDPAVQFIRGRGILKPIGREHLRLDASI
jgi:transposase